MNFTNELYSLSKRPVKLDNILELDMFKYKYPIEFALNSSVQESLNEHFY